MPFCAYCGSQVAQVSYAPCPRCGKPSNGAPRPIAKTGSNTALVVIGVVVALFGVVAVIGILAAIAIPNLLTAQQRSKQKQTMVNQRMIASALETYAAQHNRYPAADELERALVPTYASSIPANDGWEHQFRYECWSTRNDGSCDSYAIGSSGKDGSFSRASLREYQGAGATTNFNDDIVFMNGAFAQHPEGMQTR